ncbi:hypothetical protein AAL_07423 [Moelleriella libera RCEF 2490]|uniref:Uncharacterized protein n=1 Tax=Moelleriella libera RCEF 2490 TaxID=1081109 RepID=A0A167XCN0_9HYPO|nr:hypothetical protein AAL_07423 [Moelleriella libera RCEF 2490]
MPHGIKFEEGTASPSPRSGPDRDALGLQVFDFAPVVSQTNAKSTPCPGPPAQSSTNAISSSPQAPQQDSRRNSYNSTTDEEDILQMPRGSRPASSKISVYSGSEGYFADRTLVPSRRSFQQAKSPLSYSGMSTSALPPPDSSWDYSETEWWGWVVLTVTWFVFIVGMGSCLNIWSWAWDVGKTPYAPPELEDDPTLPIVGYYPALIILTGVMAWVWVVVAWVGMKYFRHAKISGD